MNSCPKFLAAIAGTFLSLVTIDIHLAQASNFTFTSIVNNRDNKDFFGIGGGPINENGTVAFVATISSGQGIFSSNGSGAFTTALKPYPQYSYAINGLAINNSDTVAFRNITTLPPEGLFISKSGNVITVATPRDNLFGTLLTPNTFNNNDTLVFTTLDNLNNGKIITGNGGSLTTVVDTSGQFRFFDQNPTINDSNVVAFEATLKDGRQGVFTIKDGTITTIADNTSLFSGGFAGLAINNRGTVLFDASLKDGQTGIFTSNSGAISTIADTSGPFSGLGGGINDNNQVVFGATLRNGAKNVFEDGIFTGSDPIADKVIAIGDSLLGGTVTNLLFEDLNNSGQISFLADVIDDSGKTIRGVFRADPLSQSIPESTSILGLLTFGTLGMGLTLKGKLKQKSTVRRNGLTYTI
ncbi:choice-of-anchor tandem repeat NxxGxxAF-containing protein [Nostoc sp.]|uniref:choice-of-anchor tandem repeat NxxGxxAF-containing protein n=1 Tax=Nostoc sp. TaxID=1180 RepID=UPI002FF5369D